MGPELLLKRVQREKVMGDIQFRGAISDFTVIKKQIAEADYDDLLVRYNEDDIYATETTSRSRARRRSRSSGSARAEKRRAAAAGGRRR